MKTKRKYTLVLYHKIWIMNFKNRKHFIHSDIQDVDKVLVYKSLIKCLE